MSLQVLGMDAIYAAIRKMTDESSMSSDLAMVVKLRSELTGKPTFYTSKVGNLWMLLIKMILDIGLGSRKSYIASFNATI